MCFFSFPKNSFFIISSRLFYQPIYQKSQLINGLSEDSLGGIFLVITFRWLTIYAEYQILFAFLLTVRERLSLILRETWFFLNVANVWNKLSSFFFVRWSARDSFFNRTDEWMSTIPIRISIQISLISIRPESF